MLLSYVIVRVAYFQKKLNITQYRATPPHLLLSQAAVGLPTGTAARQSRSTAPTALTPARKAPF
ncbi:MAG: hypothetical protein LBV04_08765 [Deferribacteraceae bacterium]|nr:hypothetical protein [Deferribacteraceae bacterium]